MLEGISLSVMVYGLAVVAVAYFVRGVAGFGSGLIAVPLLLMRLPIDVVVPVVVLLDYIASASQGLKNWQAIVWRDIWPTLPFMVLGVLAALYVFHAFNAKILTNSLAVFIVLFAIYQLLAKAPHRSESRLWAVPAGGFGGSVGTLFGTGGPFYVAYLQLRGHEKAAFRATFATLFLIDGGNRLAGYLITGLFGLKELTFAAMFLPVMAVSLYAGGHVHLKTSPEAFKRAISVLLIASGIVLLLR
ncbi:MAG: sulfite exporter TauE/SafE family protein [Pseudomonadota bacterium]|nr:MAG: sulfite exporter TauE/SafE family protein [Pseudomonadota bacterium]